MTDEDFREWDDNWMRALVAVKCWQHDTRRKCGYGKRPDCWITWMGEMYENF